METEFYKKLRLILSTNILLLLPLLVPSEKAGIKITADKITVESGKILLAEGNVRVQHCVNMICAETLELSDKISESI